MTDQALQLSGENIGTESPRAQVHESSEHLESVENDDEKVGLSKSKQKSNHESVLNSEGSNMEAREGGEKLDFSK